MILNQRSPLPGELGIDPPLWRRRGFISFKDTFSTICVTAVLHFGSLPIDIQKIVVHMIPTVGISLVGYLCIVLSQIGPSMFNVVIVIISIILAYFFVTLTKPLDRMNKFRRLRTFDDNNDANIKTRSIMADLSKVAPSDVPV